MKTAVITGGTRGIGAGMAKDFLKKGWNVAYSGTSAISMEKSLEKLKDASFSGEYITVKCDVTSEMDITAMWEKAAGKFGNVDIWINNAGMTNDRETFNLMSTEMFEKVINVNVKGLMLATHIVYNRMLKQGYGAIYNMEGLGSNGRKIPGLTPYGTSKCAVRYFTDAFSAEVKNGPVIVGTISPGMVLTDLTLKPLREDPENNRQLIRIYNILANDPETVTPFLVSKMIENNKNGAKISWLNQVKIMKRFLLAPFSKRDIVSKHLV
ncbi:MAG TPA: SDR family oxidoreductase [Bacteroidales bacterium]|nr:SDR family oxidoreductase [Bacteroidales bacterium]